MFLLPWFSCPDIYRDTLPNIMLAFECVMTVGASPRASSLEVFIIHTVSQYFVFPSMPGLGQASAPLLSPPHVAKHISNQMHSMLVNNLSSIEKVYLNACFVHGIAESTKDIKNKKFNLS